MGFWRGLTPRPTMCRLYLLRSIALACNLSLMMQILANLNKGSDKFLDSA